MKEFPVVVADDDPTVVKILEGYLTKSGFKVYTCADGNEGLRLIQRHKPTILLADWEMPGITGPALCRKIGRLELNHEVYAVLITGNSRPEEIAAGLDEGADDYMVKPVHKAVLLAHVRSGERVLRLWKRQRQYAQKLESEIAKRRQTEEALRDSEEMFKSISASAHDAIIMMDNDGRISYWNDAAEKMFGFTRDEVIEKRLHAVNFIVPEQFRKAYDRAWPQFKKTGQGAVVGETTEVAGTRKNGEEFPAELSLSAVTIKGQWHAVGIVRDITSRKIAEAEVCKLSVVVEQCPASVVITDVRGVIEYVNPRFCEVTGYTAEEAIGQTPRILKSGLRPVEETKRLWDTILAGHVWTGEFQNKRKNGEMYWEAASISPIRDGEGPVTHFLAIKQDITQQKKTEASLLMSQSDLQTHRDHLDWLVKQRTADLAKTNASLVQEIEERRQAEAEAEAASKAKGEFLATMSHELRTPLNGIIGMTELLIGSGLTREQKKQAGLVRASGDILLRLINDILDYSKIEAGKLELEITDFDFRECVECVATLLGPQAEQKGLELSVGINPALPALVRGDPGRLQQILTNLISNAIKFTKHGQIVIRATVDDERESSVSVRVSVTDTGIGIPADKQQLLFQSFSQLDASHSRRFGGTGLGLAISKQLVEMMGGEIGAISESEHGSTFWFCVTLEKVPHTGTPPKISGDFRQMRVLAVDDNAINREILGEQLAGFGMPHELASNGADALAVLRRAAGTPEAFALAILDMQMPAMDGLQLAQAIKSDGTIADTVLLLLTSAGVSGHDEQMKAQGFSAWLNKPVRQSQLLEAITQALACAQVDAPHEPENAPEPDQPDSTPNRGGTRILAAEDNEIGQEVLRQVLSHAGYAHEIVATGRQAVEAWQGGTFDLILMDCQMPEMDGFEATQVIRRIEKESAADPSGLSRMPIIALTANALKGDREKCLEAGMDDHVAKPFDPHQLIEAIETRLKERETRAMTIKDSTSNNPGDDDLVSGARTSGCADAPPPPFEMDTVLKRWGGDREFVQKLVDKFRSGAPADLDQLIQFVADGNVEEATRAAHGLKGAAAYCGAEAFRTLAARLEAMGRAGDLSGADECLDRLRFELDRCLEHAPAAAG